MYTGEFLQMTKDQIRRALEKSQIVVGEDDQGEFIYQTVEKSKVIERVMELFDQVAFQFLQDNSSGRALEEIFGGVKGANFQKYIGLLNKFMNENAEHYSFEGDEDIRDIFSVIDGGKQE